MENLPNTNLDYVCNLAPKTTRFTERTFLFDKEYIIVRQSNYRSLGTDDYSVVEDTIEAKRVRYYPRWTFVFMLIFLPFLLITIPVVNNFLPKSSMVTETTPPPVETLTSTEEILTYIKAYVPLENGMVFSDSASNVISDEKIQELKAKYDTEIYAVLIRMGVNEIYSRYGYVFTVSPWQTYYSQQDWYKPDTTRSVDFSSFNEIEILNLKKLLQAEELIK